MAKRKITIKCAYTKEELSPGLSAALSKILFDRYLKDLTYEQAETIINNLEKKLNLA